MTPYTWAISFWHLYFQLNLIIHLPTYEDAACTSFVHLASTLVPYVDAFSSGIEFLQLHSKSKCSTKSKFYFLTKNAINYKANNLPRIYFMSGVSNLSQCLILNKNILFLNHIWKFKFNSFALEIHLIQNISALNKPSVVMNCLNQSSICENFLHFSLGF